MLKKILPFLMKMRTSFEAHRGEMVGNLNAFNKEVMTGSKKEVYNGYKNGNKDHTWYAGYDALPADKRRQSVVEQQAYNNDSNAHRNMYVHCSLLYYKKIKWNRPKEIKAVECSPCAASDRCSHWRYSCSE